MALKAARCEGCGATLEIDESKESGFCPYCGMKYYTEKIIQNTFVTNNYAGATINVQGVDVENYIKLIENGIAAENISEAMKYLDEALPTAPDNEILWSLKIKILCMNMKNQCMRDAMFWRKSYKDIESQVKDLDFSSLYNNISLGFKHISVNRKLFEESFNYVFESAIDIHKKIYGFCSKFRELESSCKDQTQKDVYSKLRDIEHHNEAKAGGFVLSLLCDENIPCESLDFAIKSLLIEARNVEKGGIRSTIVRSSGYLGYIEYAGMGKAPELKVINKKGKEKSASEFGTYLIYYIQQKHPDYQSAQFAELQNYMKDADQGCYVATCVYGSYDCPQVWILRRYRDYSLAESWFGRIFIKTYYVLSPKLIKRFGERKWFKESCKIVLDRMVSILHEQGYEDTAYKDRVW